MPTLDQFPAHWTPLNAELGLGNEMTLTTGPPKSPEIIALASLEAVRAALGEAQNLVQSALNAVEFSSASNERGSNAVTLTRPI